MNNKSGTFDVTFDNMNGVYKSTFTVGQDVQIFCDGNNPSTTMIFRGIIDNIQFETRDTGEEYVYVSGRDYSAILQDRTVLEVYQNMEVSAIIINILQNYCPEISSDSIYVTSTTLNSITFKHKSVFNAIRDLADIVGYDFWVDEQKALQFAPQEYVSSGYVFNNANLIGSAKMVIDRNDLFNEIYVYGGKNLIGWREDFVATGGSVYTLEYKPFNPYVTTDGVKQMGHRQNQTTALQSGTQYLVDFDNKYIIFTSGTSCGDNIPHLGSAIIVQYDRSRPVVKYISDPTSISAYGRRTKIIQNDEIVDPVIAQTIATSQLGIDKDPKKQSDVKVKNISSLTLGQTVTVDLPNQNINSESYRILELTWNINKENLLLESVLSVRVSQRLKEVTDVLAKIISEQKKLQAEGIDPSDVITKIYNIGGDVAFGEFSWDVSTRIIGSAFVLDHNVWGQLDGPGILDGYSGTSWGIVRSGGFYL